MIGEKVPFLLPHGHVLSHNSHLLQYGPIRQNKQACKDQEHACGPMHLGASVRSATLASVWNMSLPKGSHEFRPPGTALQDANITQGNQGLSVQHFLSQFLISCKSHERCCRLLQGESKKGLKSCLLRTQRTKYMVCMQDAQVGCPAWHGVPEHRTGSGP